MISLKTFVVLVAMLAATFAYRQRDFGFGQSSDFEESLGSAPPAYTQPYNDYKPAYTPDYKPGYANGRVKIQAYRGPNKEYAKGDGYGYAESFAPWGFYVNQPEDDRPYYKY